MNNEENKVEEVKPIEQPVNIVEPKPVEPTVIEEEVEDTKIVQPTTIPDQQKINPDNSKKKTILLVLLFVFLFAFIMFMPNINDILDNLKKETGMSPIERQAKQIEESQNTKDNKATQAEDGSIVKEKLNVLTCTQAAVAEEDYDKTVVETFEYSAKKQVESSSIKTTYTFVDQNAVYENLKTECTEDSLKYIDKKGYEVACSYSDMEVVIENSFDLSTFKTIKDGTKIIEANAKYKEGIDAVKTRLTSLGYTCK